jgi:hypothetical protein
LTTRQKYFREFFAHFVTDKFTKENTDKLFGKSWIILPLPAMQMLIKNHQEKMKKMHRDFFREKESKLINDFYKRIILYFFYISIIGNSYNESEKKAIWDLSNRWNINTPAISDMDESAERMFEILAKKKSIITDKTMPYKEAKPVVEDLDAKWVAELSTVRTLLFGKDKSS